MPTNEEEISTTFEDQIQDFFTGKPEEVKAIIDEEVKDYFTGKPHEINLYFYETMLEGIIKDAITGKPVPNVKITIPELGIEVTTDDKGYFRVINPSLGIYTMYVVWFDKDGRYHEQPQTIEIKDEITNMVEIEIPYHKIEEFEEKKKLEGERIFEVVADGYIHISPKLNIQRGENFVEMYLWRTRRYTNIPRRLR